MATSAETLRHLAERSEGPAWVGAGGNVVVVGAGKGGVGTSCVSATLAIQASRTRGGVLLIDADEDGGSLHLMMGLPSRSPDVGRLGEDSFSPRDIVQRVTPGLDLFAGWSGVESEESVAGRRVLLRRVTTLFERYSLVVVDAGSRMRSVLASCRAGASRLLCVTTPDRIAVSSSYALLKATRARFPRLPVDLVVNGASEEDGAAVYSTVRAAGKHFLDTDVGLAGTLPWDRSLRSMLQDGVPLIELDAEAPALAAAGVLLDALEPRVGAPTRDALTLRRG